VKRGSVFVALPLLALLPALAVLPLTAQQTFKSGANLVVVPVVVVDGKGAMVEGLTVDDFRIEEDGRPVPIESFVAPRLDIDRPDQSRFIVLALDNLATAAEIAYRVKNIANRFVDKLGPYDVMSAITISGGKAVTTNSKAELKAAISKFSVSAAADIMSGSERARHGLRMINALTDQVVKAPHPRKVMVFIGNAYMFSPEEPSAFGDAGLGLLAEWLDAVRATARNNVSVYVIDPQECRHHRATGPRVSRRRPAGMPGAAPTISLAPSIRSSEKARAITWSAIRRLSTMTGCTRSM
jgi:VWFA-related protein